LVIPIKESDRIIRPAQTPPQDLAKFEPAKYGLQVRKKPTASVLHTPAPSTAMDEDLPRPPSRPRRSEEEQLKSDLGRLPEEPGKRMYEAVPVEEFGVALLKGMGWPGSADKTAASTNKQVRRPERLGLGAKEGQPMTKRADYLGTKQSAGTKSTTEQLIRVASRVSVKEGPHAGRTGEVIEIIGTGVASVKLRRHPHLVQLQTSKLTLLSETTQSTDDDENVRIDGAWPGAVVRIASRSVAGGKLFHRPAVILDSHQQGGAVLCSLKATTDGTLLHDIPITALSPHIPVAMLPCKVVILGGEHAGQRGVLLQLSDSHVGTVQMEDDHAILLTLPLSSFTLAA
jgi:G patch domain/KOW motif-containing protein